MLWRGLLSNAGAWAELGHCMTCNTHQYTTKLLSIVFSMGPHYAYGVHGPDPVASTLYVYVCMCVGRCMLVGRALA